MCCLLQWCRFVGSLFGLRLKEVLPTSHGTTAKRLYNLGTLLSNERCNASLANTRLSDIGGIPSMVPICDTTNPPDERSMLVCLTYLCSRLMESSVEIRATVMIQLCNRKHVDYVQRCKVATLTGIEVFLDLVPMFRDKVEIFCLVVSLLERVVAFSEVAMV